MPTIHLYVILRLRMRGAMHVLPPPPTRIYGMVLHRVLGPTVAQAHTYTYSAFLIFENHLIKFKESVH